jgi:hypothetical protein
MALSKELAPKPTDSGGFQPGINGQTTHKIT